MTWTYSDSLSTDKDMVRFLIADTDTNRQLVSDEGIATMLTMYEDTFEAGASLCDGLAAQFARIPSMSIDGMTVKGIDRSDQYQKIAAKLRMQSAQSAGGALGVPLVSGISIGVMDSVAQDKDRVPDKFEIGGMDFPGTINTADTNTTSEEWWPWP